MTDVDNKIKQAHRKLDKIGEDAMRGAFLRDAYRGFLEWQVKELKKKLKKYEQ